MPWEGDGYKPVGYGYDSVAAILGAAHRIESDTAGLDGDAALAKRRELIEGYDRNGIIATPANSSTNELVVEATRLSILNEGAPARIIHDDNPRAELA